MAAPGYRVMAGTSMATPFVTGIVALLLEHEPTFEPDQVKTLLRAHSLIPGQPAGTFDPKWGFGLIDLSQIARTLDLQKEPARMVMGGPNRLAATL